MRIVPDTGQRVLQGSAQWRLCVHQQTACVGELVMLDSSDPISPPADSGPPFTGGFAGLAFDSHCRLFHARPEERVIEFVLWGRVDAVGVHERAAHPFDVTGSDHVAGGALPQVPLALACDASDFLYVADPQDQAVWLVDTWQQEIARRLPFAAAPLDLATSGDAVFVLLADGSIWQLAPCDDPQRMDWPLVAGAQRLAVGPKVKGRHSAWVLSAAGQPSAQLHALHAPRTLPAAFCTDLLIEPSATPADSQVLILAQRPGEELRRLQILPTDEPLAGLVAPNYDGRGIELAPDGRVAYWTAQGLRHAAPARGRYQQTGLLFATALDAEHDQSRWGRLLVEACLPEGTTLRFWAFTRDELDFFNEPVGGPTPAGVLPVLSQASWTLDEREPQALYRDPSLRPMTVAPAEGFALYDAPVIAPPGRYLFLVFQLEGTRSKSPRLRGARVAYPGHALLQLLPRTLWREPAAREFLYRLLAPIAAMLDEWESVAAGRQRLLDPRIAPGAALPWLAQFVGLVLDPCWPPEVQRRLIPQAAPLFRTRGTLASLQRMLELLTGAEVVIIEQFRLRGGGVVGNPASVVSQAVLGGGYRVGGRIGEPSTGTIEDAPPPDFDDFAHRFTVTIVAALSDEQLTCARRLVEQHKPAHTAFTLCTAETGVRAGVGSHIGISSVIGRTAGFQPAIAGDAALGAGFLLGRPALRDSDEEDGAP
ncbi:phage tail protein [Ramlibacter sp. XY19]|uniref:phage tail protein n=1 Tax=Ramlibacter paludis TaxID=2908000 RepID=UPI0023DB4861|nr:phage tail protein [Ramlibacter paludis]MCG2593190.1 phage tail protein [Ramlibacter paludis]